MDMPAFGDSACSETIARRHLVFIDNAADYVDTRLNKALHCSSQQRMSGHIQPREHQCRTSPLGNDLSIRRFRRRWRIDQDDIKLIDKALENQIEHGAPQQLLRVWRQYPGREYE